VKRSDGGVSFTLPNPEAEAFKETPNPGRLRFTVLFPDSFFSFCC